MRTIRDLNRGLLSTHNLFPIAFLDSPKVLNATVTPIPGAGSAPLQVVANIGLRAAYAIDFQDTTDDYIGVYIGAAGSETLVCIIGGGAPSARSYGVFHAGSRVSFRSLTASAITNGYISATFMGLGWNGQVS